VFSGNWGVPRSLRTQVMPPRPGALGAVLAACDRYPGVPGQEVGEGDWSVIIDRGTWREAQARRSYRPQGMTGGGGGFICCVGWWCKKCGWRWPDPPVKTPPICAPGTPISARSAAPAGSVPPG
jgi:hypothetical protein